jgi:hypothetical protein
MGIKKVLLSLGLCTFVSAFGISAVNAKPAPTDDDQAQQACPQGEKCDRPAPDQKKLKKGEARRDDAAPEGKEHRKAKTDADDRAAPGDEGKEPPKAKKERAGEDDRAAPQDDQKQPKDHKKKPPKPADDEDQDQ